MYPPLLETDLDTAIASAKKAMFWIHATSQVDMASRRAFVLCENVITKIAPRLGIDLRDWPDGSGFVVDFREGRSRGSSGNVNGIGSDGTGDGNGNGNLGNSLNSNGSESGSGMESFEELVDFEGGAF